MKKQQRTKPSVVVGLVVALAGGAALFITVAAQQQQRPRPAKQASQVDFETRRQIEQARRDHGLHAAAKVRGSYTSMAVVGGEALAGNLEVLAAEADVIVIGHVEEAKTRLERDAAGTARSETIVTVNRIRVSEVLSGDPSLQGQTINVVIPGGRFEFPDGTFAEIRTPGFAPPYPGPEYIVFAERDRGNPERLSLAFGGQGLYEIDVKGTIVPHGRYTDPTTKAYKGKKTLEFKQAVLAAKEKVSRGKR